MKYMIVELIPEVNQKFVAFPGKYENAVKRWKCSFITDFSTNSARSSEPCML